MLTNNFIIVTFCILSSFDPGNNKAAAVTKQETMSLNSNEQIACIFFITDNQIGDDGIKEMLLAVGYQTTLGQFESQTKPGTQGLMRLCVSVSIYLNFGKHSFDCGIFCVPQILPNKYYRFLKNISPIKSAMNYV